MYNLSAHVTKFVASNVGNLEVTMKTTPKMVADEYIQSLKQPKEVVAVEFEMIDKDEYGIILTKPIPKITKSEQYPDGLLTVTKIHHK